MIIKIVKDREEIQIPSKDLDNNQFIGNKENYDWLMESKAQLENGQCAVHELIKADTEQ